MSIIGWRITKDHCWQPGDLSKSREGRIYFMEPEHRFKVREILDGNHVQQFQIFDDDGNLYYEGVATPATEFEPLEWAKDDAGATSIKYKNPNTGEFETL